MNEIISKIINNLKEGEILEDINVNKCDAKVINYPKNKKTKPVLLKKGLVAGVLGLSIALGAPAVLPVEPTKVEAAKDKKKPKLTMKGKSRLYENAGNTIKLGKVTAKDNVDGNITKKISVTVKKNKKSFKSIAKKIKSNKSFKITEEGTYVITYTVKDKAGNKTTKTRYLTIMNLNNKQEKTTEAPTTQKQSTTQATKTSVTTEKTTQAPSTTQEKTTEEKTTEEKTTENKTSETTTENKTTEYNTTENKTSEKTTEEKTTQQTTTETLTTEDIHEDPNIIPTDFSKYNIKTTTINGKTYKVTSDEDFYNEVILEKGLYDTNMTIDVENDYNSFMMELNNPCLDNNNYIKYLGNIKVTDRNGKDITDRIIICDYKLRSKEWKVGKTYSVKFYIEDEKGYYNVKTFNIDFTDESTKEYYERNHLNYQCVDEINNVFGHVRGTNINLSKSEDRDKVKKLVLA